MVINCVGIIVMTDCQKSSIMLIYFELQIKSNDYI